MRYKMNDEIEKWEVFKLVKLSDKWFLSPAPEIQSTDDYNHCLCEVHHFVKYQRWERDPKKYNNIQKLIAMPKIIHEHLESPIYGLSDEKYFTIEFIEKHLDDLGQKARDIAGLLIEGFTREEVSRILQVDKYGIQGHLYIIYKTSGVTKYDKKIRFKKFKEWIKEKLWKITNYKPVKE